MKRVKVNFNFKSMALALFALVLSSNVWGADCTGTIFTETFDDCAGTGGNDGSWSGTIAQGNFKSDNSWTVANASGANKCAKFGTGSKKGTAKTPALGCSATTATLTFKAGAWNASKEKTTLYINITGGGTLSQSSVTLTKGAWKTFTITLNNIVAATQIEFAGNSTSDSRFFLDEITIEAAASSYTVTKTLNNCSVTGTAIPATTTTGFSTTISANSGYQLPSTISVSGASHTWNASTGALTISSVTGNVSITITATAAKTISSIAVTTSPKTNYTTCEKLVVSDWKVTATYSDATTSDVTSGCTFSPANGADLAAGSQTVTVTHTASGKTTTKTVTVTQGAIDTFVDKVQETADQYGECNYTIPSCGDKTKGTGCEGEHYKFIGWSSTQIQAGTQPTEPDGLLKAGGSHNATGATYYAVWAKEQ